MLARKRNGQMVIMAALVMALMIFSVAISVFSASTQYQQLKYDQAREVLSNFREDFGRALTDVLAALTQRYNVTAEMETPRFHAYYMYSYWTRAAARAFASQGIQLSFDTTQTTPLQPAGVFYGYSTNDEVVGNLTKLYWYTPQSISAIYSGFSANLTALGVYNWTEIAEYYLNTTLDAGPDFTGQTRNSGPAVPTVLNVTVGKENGLPVEDLNASSFQVDYFDSGLNQWAEAQISLLNNGGGSYTLNLLSYNGTTITDPIWKYLMVWVQDSRGIITESYTYTHVDYTVQENALSAYQASKPGETYDLELLYNGSLMWYNTVLNMTNSTIIPIPLPPVKQFRVNATITGPGDTADLTLNTVPSQVEVWNPDLVTPSVQFANWQLRFNNTEKLVFELNFSYYSPTDYLSSHQQTGRIYWLSDGDAAVPSPLVNITINGNFTDISNGLYTLRMVANGGYSVAIDWSMSMIYGGNHVEYTLTGVGWSPYPPPSGGGAWLPDILPYGAWTILAGPIRAVAYRSTAAVWGSLNDSGSADGPWFHNETILIPYNTRYWQLYEAVNWTMTYTDHAYYDFLTMISGTSSSIGVANWAYQQVGGTVRSGVYSGSPTGFTYYTDYSYWLSQYQGNFGEAVLPSTAYVNNLTNIFAGVQEAITPWTSADYDRHVLDDMSYRYANPGMMTVPVSTLEKWTAGVWAFDGFSGSNWTTYSPDIYYKMFVEQFYPTIVAITGGF